MKLITNLDLIENVPVKFELDTAKTKEESVLA